jgi:hypothetical protein
MQMQNAEIAESVESFAGRSSDGGNNRKRDRDDDAEDGGDMPPEKRPAVE